MNLENVSFEKISLLNGPDYSVAVPIVKVVGNNIVLSYCSSDRTNSSVEKEAKILFVDCLVYRIGSPNDMGFFVSHSPTPIEGGDHGIHNGSIYSRGNFPLLEFDNLYKVLGFDWKKYSLVGAETIILNNDYKNMDGYNHYVFFMKDGTFECIARELEVLASE